MKTIFTIFGHNTTEVYVKQILLTLLCIYFGHYWGWNHAMIAR